MLCHQVFLNLAALHFCPKANNTLMPGVPTFICTIGEDVVHLLVTSPSCMCCNCPHTFAGDGPAFDYRV